MGNTRVNLTIVNMTPWTVTCTDIRGGGLDSLKVGMTLAPGQTLTDTSSSNDRIGVEFTAPRQSASAGEIGAHIDPVFELVFTCPISSTNSACGLQSGTGLQPYAKHGTPVSFTYHLGTPNLADWDHGNLNDGATNSGGWAGLPQTSG